MSPYFIGIAGPTSSGKTTLAKLAANELGDTLHVQLDDFFNDKCTYPMAGKWRNMEIPQTVNYDLLYKAALDLKNFKNTNVPIYCKEKGKRIGQKEIQSAQTVVFEGYLLFHDPRLLKLLDLKVFIDVSEENQLQRRIKSYPNMELDYFHQVIIPCFKKHGASAKEKADFILNGNESINKVKADFLKILKKQATAQH